MIRIKVVPIRDYINKIKIFFIIVVFLFFIYSLNRSIDSNKLDDYIMKSTTLLTLKEEQINAALKKKVPFIIITRKQDSSNNVEKEILYDYESTIKEQENAYITIDKYDKYIKPYTFEVVELENGSIMVGNAIVDNNSKKKLDFEILKKSSDVSFTEGLSFLIFHTHTSETYKISEDKYSDFYRTEDPQYNICAVGKVLTEYLKSAGFFSKQDTTVHDYPSYNGAYKASLNTVTKRLEEKNYDFLFDIHRDAISSNYSFNPTVTINGEKAAKLMFVIGTDGAGQKHDNWIENLKLAIMIQNKANEMYPGLFRNISLCNSRYNQQISTGSLIIEVGATGNTLDEAKNSMKYFANVLVAMLNN